MNTLLEKNIEMKILFKRFSTLSQWEKVHVQLGKDRLGDIIMPIFSPVQQSEGL